MGTFAFGPLESMDMLAGRPPRTPAPDRAADPRLAPSAPPAARRWWFTFDGWRSADVDSEYVLA